MKMKRPNLFLDQGLDIGGCATGGGETVGRETGMEWLNNKASVSGGASVHPTVPDKRSFRAAQRNAIMAKIEATE